MKIRKFAISALAALFFAAASAATASFADEVVSGPDLSQVYEVSANPLLRGTATWPNSSTLASGERLRFVSSSNAPFPISSSVGVTFSVTLTTKENNFRIGYYMASNQTWVYCSASVSKSGSNYVYTAKMFPAHAYSPFASNETVAAVTIKGATLVDN
jgi:hypothetical protein